MRSFKFSFSRLLLVTCASAIAAGLGGCGSGLDPGYARNPRFATSAPLLNSKRDPSFLSYAVPENEIGRAHV